MNLEEVIQAKRLVDIVLYPASELTYSGICLKANKHIWIMINYDHKLKRLNGVSVFKNQIIETYSIWKKKAISIHDANLEEYVSNLPIALMNTLHSSLKIASGRGLIAVFTKDAQKSYKVGKVTAISKTCFSLKSVTKKGTWSQTQTIDFANVDFFSFLTSYEYSLAQKLAMG